MQCNIARSHVTHIGDASSHKRLSDRGRLLSGVFYNPLTPARLHLERIYSFNSFLSYLLVKE